jgi:fibronectin type 3 domain-containing protein
VASEGAISLIWEANAEPDLAGYLVLRGVVGDPPGPLMDVPIGATTYRDATVKAGVRYGYLVIAVDKAGNRSEPSVGVAEIAR